MGWVVVLLVLGGVAWWIFRGAEDDAVTAPDILVISLDTVRADHMGFLGKRLPDGRSPTPNLDRLASRCAPMREGVTPAPLTLPAHVSVMSGLYPDRHGARENDSFRVPPSDQRDFPLLAELLKERGYRTGAVVSGQPLEARYGLDAGFGSYQDTDSSDNPVGLLQFRERIASETTKLAADWLSGGDDGAPWFLFAHYFDAHDPYLWHGPHAGLDEEERKDRYLSEIMFLDHWVGKLLDALPDDGRNTAIFVFADHGEGLGEHGELTHGFTLHQGTLRVPFLFKAPEGVDTSAFGEHGPPGRLVDVMPTALALAGCDVPENLDGRSLLDEPPADWHAFAETLYPYYQFQYAHDRCCQSADRKLLSGGGRERLYAWKEDRAEADDIAGANPAQVAGLRQWLNAHLTRPGRSKAFDVLVEPSAAFPYMGGRPLSFPIEPKQTDNDALPLVETRWDVVAALDKARAHLRKGKMEPNIASAILAPFRDELDTNPSLLWWTARAAQLEGRNGALSKDTRVKLTDRAIVLYERHHRQFKDGRAFDATLRSMLDKEELSPSKLLLEEVVRRVRRQERVGPVRALTLALQGRALFKLGELEEAREALRRACRLETDPSLRKLMGEELQRIEGALETVRGG